ncbi:MAG: hypothetical protein R2780_10020 [Crocinitomicaceae bacterium]|nr:hypothetical protein [Crocinitomicaceae bacterium]
MKKRITTILLNSWPYFIGLAVGLVFSTFNIIGFPIEYYPGDLGDARFNMYVLEHAHQFFTGDVDSYWDAGFMYPMENMMSWSDNLLGTAPIYSFLRLIGMSRELAFSSWFLILVILNYSTAYLFLRKLLGNKYAAPIGAMIFAFSVGLQSQLVHAQTYPRFAIPLAMLFALYFYWELKVKFLILSVFMVVYQFYCGIYLGLMLGTMMIITFLVLFILKRKEIWEKLKQWKWTLGVTLGIVLALLILMPLMLPYMSSESEGYPLADVLHSVPTIKSYLYGQHGTIGWEFLSRTAEDYPAPWAHQIFPGGLAILGVVIITSVFIHNQFKKHSWFSQKLKKEYLLFFISGLVTLLFFLKIGDFTLYQFIYKIPGYISVRAVQRIINVEMIFFAFAVGLLVWLILEKWGRKDVLIFILFIGIIVVDNYQDAKFVSRTSHSFANQELTYLRSKMKYIPEGTVVSYEPEVLEYNSLVYHISAMLVAQEYHLKCVNGYTSKSPEGYWIYSVEPNEVNRNYWLEFKDSKADTVYIVH